jgi:hypothetical protein
MVRKRSGVLLAALHVSACGGCRVERVDPAAIEQCENDLFSRLNRTVALRISSTARLSANPEVVQVAASPNDIDGAALEMIRTAVRHCYPTRLDDVRVEFGPPR